MFLKTVQVSLAQKQIVGDDTAAQWGAFAVVVDGVTSRLALIGQLFHELFLKVDGDIADAPLADGALSHGIGHL